MNKNEFGRLVKAYRNQRGWTQDELADRWGYSRGYLAQIERGQRKLDSVSQVARLADILDIPQERLEAIGRGIPERKINPASTREADNAILQMLLAPGRDMARLSYLAWIGDQQPAIEENLQDLVYRLDQALTAYRGEFLRPAQQLLAYTHQMLGRIAYDRLDFAAAGGHLSEMIDLGQELNDPDIITVGMSGQGSILRKRGRFDTALKCFDAAKGHAKDASIDVQGQRLIHIGATYADKGDPEGFESTINATLELTANLKPNLSSLSNEFSLEEALREQAAGYRELWMPEKALETYKEIDRMSPPFRPLRDEGRYSIGKGKAYLYAEDLDRGIDLCIKGIQLASEYQSKRHIGWVESASQRLTVLPIGKDKRLNTLKDALVEAQRKQANW